MARLRLIETKPPYAVLCASLLALAAITTASAAEETAPPPTGPGAGFVDPAGIPARPRTPDIEPVYRGPAIDTLAIIRARGTLRVGVAEVPPMVMHDKNGELVGYSIDLARKLAEDLGTDVEFVPTSWTQVIPDLINKNSDVIITGLWITAPRALVVNYTDPTATEGIYLIASKAQAGSMSNVTDFNRPDVRLAAYADTIQERLTKKYFPKATVVTVKGDELELTPVLDGKAHAVLVPTFSPQAFVQVAPDQLFVPIKEPLQSTVSAMGIRKGDADFLNYLNSWLRVHRDDGWLDERIEYWSANTDWLQ